MQEAYGCIFDFDTYNRKINVRSINEIVNTKPVYLSTKNLIKEIEIEENTDELVTANEKLSIPIDGFHIFLLRDKKPCTTEYKLCIYINNRLPETYISITHPSPVCNTVKFNDHVYS